MTRRAALAFLLLYALWAAVRVPALTHNVTLRDDWVHEPWGHLTSYRPLLAADLWFWDHVAGAGYLRSSLPKFIAGAYVAAIGMALIAIALRRGASSSGAFAIATAYVVHPINNELTLFNVLVATNLALLLIIGGDWLVARGGPVAAGALLIALGIAGYQIYAFIPLAILMIDSGRRPLQRLAACAAGGAIYGAYVVFSNRVLHVASWGGRGLGAPAQLFTRAWMTEKWHGVTNALADVFQPILGYTISAEFAFRAWKWMLLAIIIALGMRLRSAWRALLPLVACAFFLVLNVTPSGWRVDGPALFGVCLALIPLMSRPVAVIILGVWIAASAITSFADAKMRVAGKELDDRIVRELAATGRRHVVIANVPTPPPPVKGRVLLAEYNAVTPSMYSNLIPLWSFPAQYLAAHGFVVDDLRPSAQCTSANPYRIVVEDRVAVLCRAAR
jgi:hypothetical protein